MRKMELSHHVVVVPMLLVPNIVAAATLDLTLCTHDDGTWELYGMTSAGDNDGLSNYEIQILNSSLTTHNVVHQGSGGMPVNGFRAHDDKNHVLFAAQNTNIPSSILYGIGSPDFTVPPPPSGMTNSGMPAVGAPFGPFLVASGTAAATPVDIGDTSANVWSRGQGAVNGFQRESVEFNVTFESVSLCRQLTAGDFDKDGDVDGSDFLVWQANFPTLDGSATSNSGDANGDALVNGEDFLIWQNHFVSGAGRTRPDPAARIPEPASWSIAAALGGLFASVSRRRSAPRSISNV